MSAIIQATKLLAVQKICAITVCKSCKIGLPSERSAKTHLVERHSLAVPKARSQAKKASNAANAALSEPHSMRDAYLRAPSIPQHLILNESHSLPSLLPPLEGIETTTGYQCVACHSCFVSERRIREHFASKHANYNGGIETLWQRTAQNGLIRLQSLFGGNKTKYFPVSSADPEGEVLTAPDSSAHTNLPPDCPQPEHMNSQQDSSQPPNSDHQPETRNYSDESSRLLFSELDRVLTGPTDQHKLQNQTTINPFLARTLLDQHLKDFNVTMEQAAGYSALLSDRSPIEKLVVEDVTRYLLRVPKLVMHISQSVLRDVNLRGYKEFTAVSDKSAERYARNFARVIISAHRVQHFTFFPATIRLRIDPYFSSIQNPSVNQTERLSLLHNLISSIAFQTLDNIDSPRNLFFFQFIAFASVLNTFRSPTGSFRFADASDISPLLASLLYGATSCAITEIYSLGMQAEQLSSNSLPHSSQNSLPENENGSQLPAANPSSNPSPHRLPISSQETLTPGVSKIQLNARSEQVLACFDEANNSAPSTIRRLLTTAHEISKAEDVKFTFDSCQQHHLCGIIKGVHIKMKDLGNITKSLHLEINTLIDNLTYGAPLPDEFFTNVAAFKDSIQDKSPGYSFLTHSDNLPKVREFTLWLFRQLTSSRPAAKATFCPSPSTSPTDVVDVLGSKVRRQAAQDWLATSKLLQDNLLVCQHISSGSPGRSTELERLCLYNTPSHLRNIYIAQGRAMIVTRYVKQRWLIGADKIIPRFPDEETSKLLLTYLVLFRPLEAIFIEKLFGPDLSTTHLTSLFTERGTPFSAARIREVVTSTFHAHSLPIPFNHLRHYSAGIIPTITENSPALAREQLIADAREIAHLQAGHSSETAESNYARRSNDLPSVPLSVLNNYRIFSYVWHTHLGLNKSCSPPVEETPQLLSSSEPLASHSASLPSSITASISETVSATVKREFQKFTTVLSGSKRSLSSKASSLSPNTKRPFTPRTLSAPPRDALKDLTTFLPTLRSLLRDDNASFTSQMQLHVTAAVKENEHNLMVLMPTGSGKSLTVFLPAVMEPNSSTVVLVPLAALIHEHVSTCSKLGISVATWENRHTQAQIYVVSMDHTVQELRSFLLNLQGHNRLNRIVIDEAHLLLHWYTFRASIQRIPFALQACDASVQLVLLTATLPPSHRERLLNLLSVPSIMLYASPTSRANLRFTLISCDYSDSQNRFVSHRTLMMNALSVLLRESLDLLIERNSTGKILVFSLYRHETEKLKKEIENLLSKWPSHQGVPVRCYHAAMSASDLKSVYDFWKSPEPKLKIVVATSAFGTGLDVPDVRFVIHFGGAAGLLQYAQEAGRAGRDGKSAQCTIIYNKMYADEHTGRIRSTTSSPSFSTEEFIEDQAHDWQLLREYMEQSTQCRKNFIYSCIDGEGPGLCLFNNASENCDVCDDLLDNITEPPMALLATPQLPSLQDEDPHSTFPSPIPPAINNPDRVLLTPLPSQNIVIPSLLQASPEPTFPLPVSRRLSYSNSPEGHVQHVIPPTAQTSPNILQEFRSICRSLENLCVPCLVYSKKEELSEHRCSHMRNRCRRCFQLGHQVGSCSSFDPKRKNHCYSCSLNQLKGENVHLPGEFGRMCFMGVARDVAWAYWAKDNAARENITISLLRDVEVRRLQQVEQNSSTHTDVLNFYNTWLRTSWEGIPNLVRFCLWWYNVARKL